MLSSQPGAGLALGQVPCFESRLSGPCCEAGHFADVRELMPHVHLDWTTGIVQRRNNRVLHVRLLNGMPIDIGNIIARPVPTAIAGTAA